LDRTVFDIDIENIPLNHRQVWVIENLLLHGETIKFAVGLGPWTPNRWSLLAVKQSKLYARRIGNSSHQPVERVNLPYQVALSKPPNCRVAGHHADRIGAMRYQSGSSAQPCRCACSFTAGMSAPDNDDVKSCIHVLPHETEKPVSRESFADAKLRKDHIQKLLDIYAAGNAP
jgi:hypothetical protein